MSDFEDAVIRELKFLRREVERLKVKERPTGGVTDHGLLTGLSDDDHPQYLLAATGKAADSDKLDGVDSSGFVNMSSAQTVGGTKTFSSIPVLPSTNPTLANQAIRKGYADATYRLASTAIDHGSLTGLGDNDHPQYLLTTGKAADSDKLDGNDSTAFATAGHLHDDRYSLLGHLHDDRYSLLGHLHDDRYYTELEIDSFLSFKADKSTMLTAGDGLTGGGDLSANRRFDVGAGNGITVGEDTVSVDLNYNFTWMGVHSFQNITYASSIMPHISDVYDLGSSASLWRNIWASELSAIVFAQYTQVLLGGWFTVSKGEGVLEAAVSTSATSILLDSSSVDIGDIIVFRGLSSTGNPQVEYMKITGKSGTTYSVTRNLDGSGANAWPAGSVYANYGTTGNGRIELNAYDTPRISVFSHANTIAGYREQVRIGDLINGWGYSTSTYGSAFGAYESGKANITIDPTNGIRLRNYNTNAVHLDGEKVVIGEYASGKPNVLIDSNGLYIRNYTTQIIKLTGIEASFENVIKLGTYGRLQQGTGTWGTDFTGSAIWNESGVMNIGGWNNNVKQWWGGSDGALNAAAGDIRLDKDGINVVAAIAYNPQNRNNLKWYKQSDILFNIGAACSSTGDVYSRTMTNGLSGGIAETYIASIAQGTNSIANIQLVVSITDGKFSSLQLLNDGNTGVLSVEVDTADLSGNLVVDGTIKDGSGNLYGRPVFLTTPKTSDSWDGDTKTTDDRATVDLSAVFGVPAGVKAVMMTIQTQGNAVNDYIRFGPNSTYNYALTCRTLVANVINVVSGIVPCDANGDVYCYTSTTDVEGVWVWIWGWWL